MGVLECSVCISWSVSCRLCSLSKNQKRNVPIPGPSRADISMFVPVVVN